MDTQKTYHVAILPSPGLGHTIPVLALGKRIMSMLQGFQVTIFIATSHTSTAQSELLQSQTLTEGLRVIQLPPTDISGQVPTDAGPETRICATVRESIPALKSTIMEMVQRPTVLIVDIFGTDAFDLADELGMLKYVFITTTASVTALMMYLPTLDKEIQGEYIHQKEPIQVPGCKPIQIEDLMNTMLDRKKDVYPSMLCQASRYPMAHGILINTCEELEPTSIKSLKMNPTLQEIPTPPVYPVGPLTRLAGSSISGHKCLDWLDKQPKSSVLFVSFGSGGTLSSEQITELAWGLEQSHQRFLWVVRQPTDREITAGTFFTSGSRGGDPSDYLPEGFLDRTLGVGLVVPSWCPQLEILKHESVGGCLSHCGWNSILECIVHGVPLITWPLYAEQKMNASMLVEDIGIAIRPNDWPRKELIRREEIDKMVRQIMQVEENPWRVRAKELKNIMLRALDEGGSSYNSLLELAEQWKIKSPLK